MAVFFDLVAAEIPRFIEAAVDAAGSDLRNDIIARTFPSTASEGLDANGQQIKQGRGYSAGYAKIRKDAGKQTGYVDFDFTGDLRRSVQGRQTAFNSYVVDFSTDVQAKKARENEQRYRQQIWFASEAEVTKCVATLEALFFQQLDDFTKSLPPEKVA